MEQIISDLLELNFEELEKQIFEQACKAARELTVKLLEQLDDFLMKSRDRKRYVSKQTRKATIKTVYGEVEYNRRQYFDTKNQEYVFLLEDKMEMEKIGTISSNLSKQIAAACIEMPFRKASETISKTTGQTISSHGAWNVIQNIGDLIDQDEKEKVNQMEQEQPQGRIESQIIFMEADGVWLNIQGDKKKNKDRELKLATIYDGWSHDGKKLNNRKVIAGMESAKTFNRKVEALVQSVYNIDYAKYRVLNGDGAAWISNTENPDRIFQLDRFHIMQKIRTCIPNKKICSLIINNFINGEYEDMLGNIDTYINSIDDGTQKTKVKAAKDLFRYLSNNYEGLAPWQEQVEEVPEAPEGIEYKNLGTQENHNCSLITGRMKHRKMRWSEDGASNLAKVICARANEELDEIIERTDGTIFIPIEETKPLTPNKIPIKIGKGNKYIETLQVGLPILDGPINNSSNAIRAISF